MKIDLLIVDDSPVARKILRMSIPKDLDCSITEATNGLEGLEKYKEINPTITFLDLTMPVMNGNECLVEIKKYNPNALVIVLTANIQVGSIKEVMEAGAFSIVKKPPKRESIQKVLDSAKSKLGI